MTNLSGGTNPLSDRDGLKSNMHSLTVRACMMCVARAALTHRTKERMGQPFYGLFSARRRRRRRRTEEEEEVPRLL